MKWQGITTALGCEGTITYDDGAREHVFGCHSIYRTGYTIETIDKDGKAIATRQEIFENLNVSHRGFISKP